MLGGNFRKFSQIVNITDRLGTLLKLGMCVIFTRYYFFKFFN